MQTDDMMTMTYDDAGDGYTNDAARAGAYFLIERGGLKDARPRAAALTAAGKVVVLVAYPVYGPSDEVLGEEVVIDLVADTRAEAEVRLARLIDNDSGGEVNHWIFEAPAPRPVAPEVEEDDDCPF